MARTMDAYRADLAAEQLGGWISGAERHVRELIESNRRAYLATRDPLPRDPLHPWSGVLMLFRPSASLPDHYRQPLEAPDPVPPLPGWIAEYLYDTACRLLVLLVQLVPNVRARAADLAWCRRQFEATGEELYVWVAVLLLRPRKGTVLPDWMAVALFRVARDLDDQMAGRDLAQRPPAHKVEELFAWQVAERPPRANAEELLTTFGFPLSPGRGAFIRVHGQMAAAAGFPLGLRLRQKAPRVSRKAIFAAFGFPVGPGLNPSAGIRKRLRDQDALFAAKVACLVEPGTSIEAARKKLGVNDPRFAERSLRRARRLALGLPERDAD